MTTPIPSVNYAEHIDFNGESWRAIKAWLEERKDQKVKLLIGAGTHDLSNQIRGSLQFISELLALENASNSGR